ncbi:putative proline--tRNA ligase, mitochondrial, partial [Pseudolycoriella hygida]
MSYKQLPLRLYQIGNKFREEQRPKHGLLRSKEFLMKDSYSFDIDRSSALKTYEEFSQIYKELFQAIGVTVTAVEANAGNIGGSLSHEYQIAAEIGEDEIVKCPSCAWSSNLELSGDITTCPKCQSQIERNRSIEVAHTFVLDDKYSKPLRATFQPANGKPSELMMGCYGIGITRLIAASVETLSTENEIRWPFALAPFSILIIPPKGGSHEEASAAHLTNVVYGELCKTVELSDDIVVDDRLGLTIGKRLLEARKMGYPMIIVIGKEAAGDDGKYEIHFTDSNVVLHLRLNDLLNEVNKKLKLHCFR